MVSDDLAWRVEAACREAWPCPDEIARDGWLIRRSGGPTRRTNSVNPLPGRRSDIATILAPAAAIYAAHRQPLIVRVPALAAELDPALDRLGFGPAEAETITLHATTTRHSRAAEARQVGPLDEAWLIARARLSGWDPPTARIFRAMLAQVASPVGFAASEEGGAIVAAAYGAIAQRLLVIEAVVTDPAYRRRGHGARVVGALIAWARARGIDEACLQVAADNHAARALYQRLGFTRELYRYHYRRLAAATSPPQSADMPRA